MKLFSFDVALYATAYVTARTEAEARAALEQVRAFDTTDGLVNVDGRPFVQMTDDPSGTVTISPAMTLDHITSDTAEVVHETFAHMPDRCPSNHWNRGDDICADCGADLNA